jgi:hypothetical protein
VVRKLFRPDGTPIDSASEVLRLGDLAFVVVELVNDTSEQVTNVALVDRLPAGFEIENPRLGRDQAFAGIDPDTLWESDHLDVRDDRLEVFGALPPRVTQRVVYAVRATSAGSFGWPATNAEAMYNPRVWARGAAGSLRVDGGR